MNATRRGTSRKDVQTPPLAHAVLQGIAEDPVARPIDPNYQCIGSGQALEVQLPRSHGPNPS